MPRKRVTSGVEGGEGERERGRERKHEIRDNSASISSIPCLPDRPRHSEGGHCDPPARHGHARADSHPCGRLSRKRHRELIGVHQQLGCPRLHGALTVSIDSRERALTT